VCMCVCVREREREREFVCVCVCVCVEIPQTSALMLIFQFSREFTFENVYLCVSLTPSSFSTCALFKNAFTSNDSKRSSCKMINV